MFVLVSHALCAYVAFALPAYATFKALRADGPLQPLARYWTVLGLFVACEQAAGFVLSWLPFYYELRSLFLLYLALPHTQGSDHVYNALLAPWLAANEADIDASLAAAQSNSLAFVRTRAAAAVDLFWGLLNRPAPDQKPADHLKSLWDTYAPAALAALRPRDTKNDPSAHTPYSVN